MLPTAHLQFCMRFIFTSFHRFFCFLNKLQLQHWLSEPWTWTFISKSLFFWAIWLQTRTTPRNNSSPYNFAFRSATIIRIFKPGCQTVWLKRLTRSESLAVCYFLTNGRDWQFSKTCGYAASVHVESHDEGIKKKCLPSLRSKLVKGSFLSSMTGLPHMTCKLRAWAASSPLLDLEAATNVFKVNYCPVWNGVQRTLLNWISILDELWNSSLKSITHAQSFWVVLTEGGRSKVLSCCTSMHFLICF